MKSWQKYVARAIGLSNFAMAMAGLLLMGEMPFRAAANFKSKGEEYAVVPFYLMTFVTCLFLLALVVGGIYVWRLSRRGLVLCNIVFMAEICYWFVVYSLSIPPHLTTGSTGLNFRAGIGATGVIANLGMWPQFISLYPFLALVMLNVAYRRSSASSSNN
jgi:hypothetical protein